MLTNPHIWIYNSIFHFYRSRKTQQIQLTIIPVSALETQTHTSQTTPDTVQQHNQATVDIVQPHVIGFPAVSEIQSCAVNSDPNLADKQILWTRVTSGGLSLSIAVVALVQLVVHILIIC